MKALKRKLLKIYINDLSKYKKIWQGASGTIYFFNICIEFRPLMKY